MNHNNQFKCVVSAVYTMSMVKYLAIVKLCDVVLITDIERFDKLLLCVIRNELTSKHEFII